LLLRIAEVCHGLWGLIVMPDCRWIEEPVGSGGSAHRRRIFQVQLEDGRRCRLTQEPDGSWTLAHTAYGR
jgi:hypothetical protein